MTVFRKIGLFCLAALVSLPLLAPAHAASSNPRIVIPPRTGGIVQCDFRGCFGFGPHQWYRRPGDPLPRTVPGIDRGNRFDNPRVHILPQGTTVTPKPVIRSPLDNRERHQSWCARRYRTYNPGTNMYTTLHNGFQVCHSPWG